MIILLSKYDFVFQPHQEYVNLFTNVSVNMTGRPKSQLSVGAIIFVKVSNIMLISEIKCISVKERA